MGRPSPYTEEFKAQAVDLVHNTDRTQADVAASLGINKNTLNNWVTNAQRSTKASLDPDALDADERVELARLRKENRELRQDRDILRKAAAYFAAETIR
jgi:transposase